MVGRWHFDRLKRWFIFSVGGQLLFPKFHKNVVNYAGIVEVSPFFVIDNILQKYQMLQIWHDPQSMKSL